MNSRITHHARHTGIVKSFNNTKGPGGGYGFIGTGSGADIFVHISQVRGATEERLLFAGDEVSFELGPGRGGREQAINVIIQLRAEQPYPKTIE